MRIIKTLGAAFLLVGTVGAVLVSAAYNENYFTYRADGMIMINGDVFYPLGVYFIPCCDERPLGDRENPAPGTFWYAWQQEGRGFLFEEFAEHGGNFVMGPCFHQITREVYCGSWAGEPWDDVLGMDLTDMFETMPNSNDCRLDLEAAGAHGIKLLPDPSLTYKWDRGEQVHYYYQEYQKFKTIVESDKDEVSKERVFVRERPEQERAEYFADIKNEVVQSSSEEAFFGWWGAQEPAWIVWRLPRVEVPTSEYLADVYDHLKNLEAAENANHPVYLEECNAGIVTDMFHDCHASCDILGYNTLCGPTPETYNEMDPEWQYNFITNAWCSAAGDAGDIGFWSVDGAKPLICCVGAIHRSREPEFIPYEHQVKFVTYDAIIHRVNGLTWGMYHYVYPENSPPILPGETYRLAVKPTLVVLGKTFAEGGINEVLKAPFDDTLVEAVVRLNGDVVERTAIVGGDLVPKNHLLSGNYLLEGCLKLVTEEVGPGVYQDFVYLITANRKGRNSRTHEPFDEYDVTFKPYFSGDWLATYVLRIESDGTTAQIPVVNGTFTDTFMGEDVNIYKFQKPPRFGES